MSLSSHLAQNVIHPIDENAGIAFLEAVIQLSLRFLHSLERAKALQMSASHIGDEPIVSLHHLAQEGNLAWMIGSCLYDDDVVLACDAKQRERHANVVVQVAFCEEHIMSLG